MISHRDQYLIKNHGRLKEAVRLQDASTTKDGQFCPVFVFMTPVRRVEGKRFANLSAQPPPFEHWARLNEAYSLLYIPRLYRGLHPMGNRGGV